MKKIKKIIIYLLLIFVLCPTNQANSWNPRKPKPQQPKQQPKTKTNLTKLVNEIFKDTNIDADGFKEKSDAAKNSYNKHKNKIQIITVNNVLKIIKNKLENDFKYKWNSSFDDETKKPLEDLIKKLTEKQKQYEEEEKKKKAEEQEGKETEEKIKAEEKIKKDFEKKVNNFIEGIKKYLTVEKTGFPLIKIAKTNKYYLVKDLISKSTDEEWKRALEEKNIVIDIDAKNDTNNKTAIQIAIERIDFNNPDGFKSIYYLIMGKLPKPEAEEEKKVTKWGKAQRTSQILMTTTQEPIKVLPTETGSLLQQTTKNIKLKKVGPIKKHTLEQAEYIIDTETNPEKQIEKLKETINENKLLQTEQQDLLKKLIDAEKITDVIEKKEKIRKLFSKLASQSKPTASSDVAATLQAQEEAKTPGYKKANLEKIKEDLSHYFTLIHHDVINELILDLEKEIEKKEKEEEKKEKEWDDDDWE